MVREIMSMLMDCLRSCLAGLANVCLVQDTWMKADFRCAEISKRLLKGAESHIIVMTHTNNTNLYLFTSFYVSGPGDQLLELLSVKVPWVQISKDANTVKKFKKVLMVSQARSFPIR